MSRISEMAMADVLQEKSDEVMTLSSITDIPFEYDVLVAMLVVTAMLVWARHSLQTRVEEQQSAAQYSQRSASPVRSRPSSSPNSQSRRDLSAEDAVAVGDYSESLSRMGRGEAISRLPPVVHRNMQLPEAEQANMRQRVGEPFASSYFWAQCSDLKQSTGRAPWWQWLGGEGVARALHDGIVAELLAAAPDEARARCIAILDVWLLQGALDAFRALRKELSELQETADGRVVTLAEIHVREADAYEHLYTKDWLLVCILNTLMPALRGAGVIAACPRRPPCISCMDEYDQTVPGSVKLVCFLPCGHWMCHACYERDKARLSQVGRLACCAECNVEAMPLVRNWPGAMVEQKVAVTPPQSKPPARRGSATRRRRQAG